MTFHWFVAGEKVGPWTVLEDCGTLDGHPAYLVRHACGNVLRKKASKILRDSSCPACPGEAGTQATGNCNSTRERGGIMTGRRKGEQIKAETGNVYGQLKVLSFDEVRNRVACWWCECRGLDGVSCGNKVSVAGHDLRRGHTWRCESCAAAASALALIGKQIGSLRADKYLPGTKDEEGQFECTCSCGRKITVTVSAFRKGSSCRRCKTEARAQRRAEKIAIHKAAVDSAMVTREADCHVCGKHFTGEMHFKTAVALAAEGREDYCSEDCRRRRRRAMRRHVYRARAAGSKIIENVDPYAIFKRDHYICQLCRLPAPQSLQGLNLPDSPEIDHRAALANGGDNVPSNMQTVHHACGAWKVQEIDLPLAAVRDYIREIAVARSAGLPMPPAIPANVIPPWIKGIRKTTGRLTDEERSTIRGMALKGFSITSIHRFTGCDDGAIRRVIAG